MLSQQQCTSTQLITQTLTGASGASTIGSFIETDPEQKKMAIADLQSAKILLERIGVAPISSPPPFYTGILEANARDKLNFKITYVEDQATCTVHIGEQSWIGKNKEEAAKKAVLAIRSSKDSFKSFLIKVPAEDGESSPTERLLTFLEENSIYYAEDSTLQNDYKSLTNTFPPQSSCTLFFLSTELGYGMGESNDKAQKAATLNALANLEKAINLLDHPTAICLNEHIAKASSLSTLKFLQALGISPLHFANKQSLWPEQIIDFALAHNLIATRAEAEKIFSLSPKSTDGRYTCILTWNDNQLGKGTSRTLEGAKAYAAKAMMMNAQYYRNFLIEVPLRNNDKTPRATLIAFLQKYSFSWSEEKNFEDTYTQRGKKYECRSTFNGITTLGEGSCEEAARENAAQKILEKLYNAVQGTNHATAIKLTQLFNVDSQKELIQVTEPKASTLSPKTY